MAEKIQHSFSDSLIEALSKQGRPYSAEDEDLHPAVPAVNPAWGETSWWSFHSPADKTMGWIYLMHRRGMGVMSLGVWIWDDTYEVNEARDLLYSKWSHHVPLGADDQLSFLRINLPGMQLEVDVIEPLKQYAIRYRDGDEMNLDLQFRAVTDVVGCGIDDEKGVGHGDQILWFTGEMQLQGKSMSLEGPAFRDRSWSERAELPTGQPCMVDFAGNESDFAFTAASMFDSELNQAVDLGFLMMDGKTTHVVDAEREFVRYSYGSTKSIRLIMTDDEGRCLEAAGERITTASLPSWTGIMCWITDLEWEAAGRTLYGHNQWGCPASLWRKLRLEKHPFVT